MDLRTVCWLLIINKHVASRVCPFCSQRIVKKIVLLCCRDLQYTEAMMNYDRASGYKGTQPQNVIFEAADS